MKIPCIAVLSVVFPSAHVLASDSSFNQSLMYLQNVVAENRLPSAEEAQLKRLRKIFVGESTEPVIDGKDRIDRLYDTMRGYTTDAQDTREILNTLEAVKRQAAKKLVDATGVVLMIDRSGSMDDYPSSGGTERKITGAVKAANNATRLMKGFIEQYPDRGLLVGVYTFTGSAVYPQTEMQPLTGSYPELGRVSPVGGTPIGTAMIEAKKILSKQGVKRGHIIIITDGENTSGPSPLNVIRAFNLLPGEEFPIVHFVAFDIDSDKFAGIKRFLPKIHQADDSQKLDEVLKSLLQDEILAEKKQEGD